MAAISRNLDIMSQVRRISKQLNGVVALCEEPVFDTMLTQASLMASEIKGVAPIDPNSPTPGALRDSVRVEEGKSSARRAFVVRILAGGPATNGSGYDYARGVEFGTQNAPAHPFFFPIYRARKKAMRAAIRKRIKLAVRAVFK